MISTLIVESNKEASNTLESLLSENCPQISICDLKSNYKDAINSIEMFNPDLVFLEVDFSLPEGLEKLNLYYPSNFEVIVTSKTESFAIHALNRCVSGYLLKPIKTDKLIKSVKYASQRIRDKKGRQLNHFISENSNLGNLGEEIIGIPTIEGYEFIPIKEIIRCEGMQKCTLVYTLTKRELISSYNIGEFRKILEKYGFFCTHKSHLINLNLIRKYHKEGSICMLNGSWVPVAKRRKKEFLQKVKHL